MRVLQLKNTEIILNIILPIQNKLGKNKKKKNYVFYITINC